MAVDETRRRVVRAIESSCGISARKIRDGDGLVVRLGYDSLRMATLAIALEEEFGRPLLLAEWIAGASESGGSHGRILVHLHPRDHAG